MVAGPDTGAGGGGMMTEMICDCSNLQAGECGPDVFSMATRVARKQHVCCECGEYILPGDKYEHVSGCWDGTWDTYKTCGGCVWMRNRYCSGGWIYGELFEQLEEC